MYQQNSWVLYTFTPKKSFDLEIIYFCENNQFKVFKHYIIVYWPNVFPQGLKYRIKITLVFTWNEYII